MRYLPNQARREAEEAILTAQATSLQHKSVALDALSARGAAERRAQEVEMQAALQAQTDEDLRAVQAAEYEARIRLLENTLEAERSAHEAHRRDMEQQLKDTRDDADARVEAERRFCREAVAAADARAQDAERAAEEARTRAEEKIAAARNSAEARVKEVRSQCDERLRQHEAQTRLEIDRLKAELAADKQSLEEKNRMYLWQRHAALNEAKRRIDEREHSLQSWATTKESELTAKEASWADWASQQQQSKKAFEEHHKKLLELEQGLHKRTMERTLDCIARHLKMGDALELEFGPAAAGVPGQALPTECDATPS